MAEIENQPRRRSSLGFIISFLAVIAVIATMVYFLFFSNRTTDLSVGEFIYYVDNKADYTTTITNLTPKEQTVVSIKGKIVSNSNNKKYISYHAVIDWKAFETERSYTDYTVKPFDSNSAVTFSINTSVSDLLAEKGIDYTVTDPYVTNFWDQWGPTIIMSLISIALMVFLFSRLTKATGNSNMQALSFNKSRARRVNTSRVHFTDVAGCDE